MLMKIASGIEMLELDVEVCGQNTIIHPASFGMNRICLLVDAGMPSNFVDIGFCWDRHEVPVKKLTIIATHQNLLGCKFSLVF